MIYRLRYCNKDGVEARVDIQKGSSTPVIEVEGTERPFILSYNNDKGDKSGMFLSSSADIEIYETTDLDLDLNFNIDNLKTSNETELSVTHYIDNVISWQGFIIPDFFSIEVRNNPVITMTASDRLGTLKNATLSDLPSMISLRELAILCLNKTGLELPLRTMADFNNGTGVNDFFNSKILTQRLSDTKGRSISCYDILSSILTASNSFLVQRSGGWHIINKIQHEAGSGKLYTGATSFINWSDVIFNFSDISIGGRRTIIPVASTVGVFHEFGGSKTYPSNYDFKDGASGWTVNFPEEMEARFDNRNILGFDVLVSGGGYQPVYGTETNNPHMVVYGFRGPLNYVKSEDIVVPTGYGTDVEIKFDINASAPIWNFGSFQRMAVFAVKDTETKALVSGSFVPINEVTEDQYMNRINFEQGTVYVGELARVATESFGVSGKLSDAEGLDGYTIHIRLYSSDRAYATVINFATINFAPVGEMAKGNLYKTERTDNYTKDHDIDTSLFADYITTGLNGYFYRYAIDDTSSLYNSANELTSKWTAYNDPEQLPLLQHVTRQRSRLFSVAHDLLSAEIEVNNFDPLAIFVACEKRYTVVSAQFDFFKSNLSVELEEVAFQSAIVRDFIYSYFGDGESGIKSIGGISGGGGGGSTGGGLTPEQLEILSFWKKDPDRENTIFTEMNAYSKLELSAYGAGTGGGGGGGGLIDTVYGYGNLGQTFNNANLTDTFNAYTINQINTRLVAVENGSALTVNTTGTGNAITSISKSGTVITANKDLTFSLSGHTHTISDITNLQTTLNNKLETSIFNAHNNDNVRHITGAERTKWDGVVDKVNEIGVYNYTTSVSATVHTVLLMPNGSPVSLTSPSTQYVYDINLQTNGTSQVTGARQVVYYDGTWKVFDVGVVPKNSNYPYIEIIEGLPKVRTDHANNYTVALEIRRHFAPNSNINFMRYMGLDYVAEHTHTFASLTSKPTTIAGYGITDAVTLNTVQTISGEKTFSSALTALISVATPKIIFNAAGWSIEQVGNELQMRHNNVLKMRFTSAGSIVATEEITAFG